MTFSCKDNSICFQTIKLCYTAVSSTFPKHTFLCVVLHRSTHKFIFFISILQENVDWWTGLQAWLCDPPLTFEDVTWTSISSQKLFDKDIQFILVLFSKVASSQINNELKPVHHHCQWVCSVNWVKTFLNSFKSLMSLHASIFSTSPEIHCWASSIISTQTSAVYRLHAEFFTPVWWISFSGRADKFICATNKINSTINLKVV